MAPSLSVPSLLSSRFCAPPQIFPAVASDGKLFVMALEGYWMDVGQPQDYLTGAWMGAGRRWAGLATLRPLSLPYLLHTLLLAVDRQ